MTTDELKDLIINECTPELINLLLPRLDEVDTLRERLEAMEKAARECGLDMTHIWFRCPVVIAARGEKE